ncbi:MAG TPA: AraC family transcriptional regulator [Niabella sp.]|nr:AraC family transcriptional regulator [Niabella sp.]
MATLLVVQIVQDGFGMLELMQNIPKELTRYILQSSSPMSVIGKGFKALFQKLTGRGFVVWIKHYFVSTETVLHTTDPDSLPELHIALHNKIEGSWDNVIPAELPALYFQFLFAPNLPLHVHFEGGKEYETFDISFEPDFLKVVRTEYKSFDLFMKHVQKPEPVNLSPLPYRCPALMLEAVQGIIHNNYSRAGKIRLLQNSIENILTAALEIADQQNIVFPELTEAQLKALHEVKRLIDENIPYYPGNKQLCRQTYLNHFTFNYGFKRLFGLSPYKYYTGLRMERGKELLRKGESVHSVAADLDFESPRAFGKAFKIAFGLTPRKYRDEFSK